MREQWEIECVAGDWEQCRKLAADGWELVSVVFYPEIRTVENLVVQDRYTEMFFKRRVTQEPPHAN